MSRAANSKSSAATKRRERPATKNEQYLATRADLVAAARSIFATHGFSGSATEQIVVAAGTTRGALYYHFKDKKDVFKAVFEETSRDIAKHLRARKKRKDPLRNLLDGCEAFLVKCMEPDVMQIYLLDAPFVLGWRLWREIDYANAASSLEASIANVVGGDDPTRLKILKSAISGMLNELAFMAADEGADVDLDVIAKEMRCILERVLD